MSARVTRRADRALAALLGVLCAPSLACGDDAATTVTEPPFRETVLDGDPGEPMALAVLPDARVLHTTRDGNIWLHGVDGGKTLAAHIPVYTHDEDGLQGIAIDPDFTETGWVYVYYSPPLDTVADDPATDLDEGLALS